jgi:hypothetical protein
VAPGKVLDKNTQGGVLDISFLYITEHIMRKKRSQENVGFVGVEGGMSCRESFTLSLYLMIRDNHSYTDGGFLCYVFLSN